MEKLMLLDALRRVDKSKNEGNVAYEDLFQALGLSYTLCTDESEFYNRFKAYYVVK